MARLGAQRVRRPGEFQFATRFSIALANPEVTRSAINVR
jgi:hypothetical protein